MTTGFLSTYHKFKPTGKGGGARERSTNREWWPFIRVAAKAIVDNYKGGEGAWVRDSRKMPDDKLSSAMNSLLPGSIAYIYIQRPPTKTPPMSLLNGRCYKMHYSGHSSGNFGVPRFGQQDPIEHWRHWPNVQLFEPHYDQLRQGVPILEWLPLLDLTTGKR